MKEVASVWTFRRLVWCGQRRHCSRGEQYVLRSSSGDFWGAIELVSVAQNQGQCGLRWAFSDSQAVVCCWYSPCGYRVHLSRVARRLLARTFFVIGVMRWSVPSRIRVHAVRAGRPVFSQLVLSSGGCRGIHLDTCRCRRAVGYPVVAQRQIPMVWSSRRYEILVTVHQQGATCGWCRFHRCSSWLC